MKQRFLLYVSLDRYLTLYAFQQLLRRILHQLMILLQEYTVSRDKNIFKSAKEFCAYKLLVEIKLKLELFRVSQ